MLSVHPRNGSLKKRTLLLSQTLMSSLKALSGFKVELDLVYSILKLNTYLTSTGKTIILCWILSRININGNERADAAAKSAFSLW